MNLSSLNLSDILNIIWILFLIQLFIPLIRQRLQEAKRYSFIRRLEEKHHSRVITMIHRQESISLLGIPISKYMDIEDSERVLRAIRFTPQKMPIDLIMHTPGGMVLAAEQIALALRRHKGKVTVYIPHYAMSGGTMVALAADKIVMDPDAVLGPVDPQLGSQNVGYYPAVSIIEALKKPNPNRDDNVLILGDISKKAIKQVHNLIHSLIGDKMSKQKAENVAKLLSEGKWTHDHPIVYERVRELGLNVTDKMSKDIYDLMELYPQPQHGRPSVEYIPIPYKSARDLPRKGLL